SIDRRTVKAAQLKNCGDPLMARDFYHGLPGRPAHAANTHANDYCTTRHVALLNCRIVVSGESRA
ncbi:MAG: hypothetical protein OXQ29_02220, partial [Rhodospirillaceae bacterium]|nr:hypothetical protein [Rhodospirillaceae bacterium]